MTVYACCDQNRRQMVLGKSAWNGIDWLDVLDLEAPTLALRQRILHIGFVNSPPPPGLTPQNVVITGGDRIVGIRAQTVSYDGPVVVVELNAYGDFSPYVLHLVNSGGTHPLSVLDPLLASIQFSFKVECPTDIDCRTVQTCPPPATPIPAINYLAKDYTAFTTLMLDRMSVTAPSWTERSEADAGVALVETLAYVADHLSYQQDAIATEAYLGTARRRVSMRRHAKLVDYAMHDGCNARAWVVLTIAAAADGRILSGPSSMKPNWNGPNFPPLPGTLLMTRVQNETYVDLQHRAIALSAAPVCFETMHDLILYQALNQLTFYTWGNARCSLPIGSTSATFNAPSPLPDMRGRVLVFQEMVSPTTGTAADADVTHRQAVRITTQTPLPPGPALTDPLVSGTSLVELGWAAADALTFPLCISSTTDAEHGSATLSNVSVAWGNVVLVDNGMTQPIEAIGTMPEPTLYGINPTAPVDGCCVPQTPTAIAARFNPSLANSPLTQQGQVIVDQTSFEGSEEANLTPVDLMAAASAAMQWDIANALPAIALSSTNSSGTETWTVVHDLLESGETDTNFVVEIDSDNIARLRFGDDEYAIRPAAGAAFNAVYRVGNGVAGNVGAGAIAHVVEPLPGPPTPPPLPSNGILTVTNPLPAQGGVDPETSDSVRQAAPAAFLVQERAVTPADYAAVSLRNPVVSAASADFRWTGSWYTVFDTVDRPGGVAVGDAFTTTITDWLERYRVIGHDLQVDGPALVPLRIDMAVCVTVPWFRSSVEQALRQLFGTGTLPNGSLAFFNPNRFSFGQTLYLSPIYALAQSVAGVESVNITRFERLYQPSNDGLQNWQLAFGQTEIPRCDNDPNYPNHGVLNLTVRGGQ